MGTLTESGGVGIRCSMPAGMTDDVWRNVVLAVGCDTPMVVSNWVLGTRPTDI